MILKMKKFFSLFVALFIVFSLSAQDNGANAKSSKKVKEPVITFDKIVHDYGNVEKGGNGECEFVFKNTGKAELILTNVRSSCGCTVPEWPKEPIQPGKKGVIKVKYNTQRVGQINKSVTVESNAVNNRIILNIKGTVINPAPEAVPENNAGSIVKPE